MATLSQHRLLVATLVYPRLCRGAGSGQQVNSRAADPGPARLLVSKACSQAQWPKEPELCRGWLLDHSPISKHMGDGVGITTTDCLTQEPTPPEVG